MRKTTETIIRDYVRNLSEEDLRFLSLRLSQRLGGDMGEAIEKIQSNVEINRILEVASGANNFFDLIDMTEDAIQQEYRKRFA